MHTFKLVFAVLASMALAACGGGNEADPALPQAQQVEGNVLGLAGGTMVLQLIAGDTLQEIIVGADGKFAFPQAVTGDYFAMVTSEPAGLACTLFNSEGLAGNGAAMVVFCAQTYFHLGGSLSGDPGVGEGLVELENTVNGERLTLASSGEFSFDRLVAAGASYNVVVSSQGGGLFCTVQDGSSSATTDDVSNIRVTCISGAHVLAADSPSALPEAAFSAVDFRTNLRVTYVDRSIVLNWDVADDRNTYRVFQDTDGVGPQASTQVGGTVTTGTFTVPAPDVLVTHLYARYAVQACNAVECSVASTQVSVSQLPNSAAELDKAIVWWEDRTRSLEKQTLENESKYRAVVADYNYLERLQYGKGKNELVIMNALRAEHDHLLAQRYRAFYVVLPDLSARRWKVAPVPVCGGPAYRNCGR